MNSINIMFVSIFVLLGAAYYGFAVLACRSFRASIQPTRRRDLTLAAIEAGDEQFNARRAIAPIRKYFGIVFGVLILLMLLALAYGFIYGMETYSPGGMVTSMTVGVVALFLLATPFLVAMPQEIAVHACRKNKPLPAMTAIATAAATLLVMPGLVFLSMTIDVYDGSLPGRVPWFVHLALLFGPTIVGAAWAAWARKRLIAAYPWDEDRS